MKTLGDIGEVAAIESLSRLLSKGRGVVAGVGDDCAVVRVRPQCQFDLLLTSDPVIEGTHFTPDSPARGIGHKAIGRVLSDIAAMGGEPLWALIDVEAPRNTPVARLRAVYRAVEALGARHGLSVVGGDMASGPAFALHVFAAGRVPHGTAILRSGARAGDAICVTGSLGGSIAGKHLKFEPRLAEGQWLRRHRWANAMIDVSDGLASDLRHLVEMSRVGARIELDRIPVSRAARRAGDGRTPEEHALYDGEDFELLFTVPAARRKAFEREWARAFELSCSVIGVITPRRRCIEAVLDGKAAALRRRGFEHFVSA